MPTMNISLPAGMKEFVEAEVADGGYSTASEYVRQLIREAQKRRAEEKLQEMLLAGLDSGEAREMTPEDWADIRRQVRDRLAAQPPR